MEKHTQLVELRERLRVCYKMESFGVSMIQARTEVKDVLSERAVLQLIMEYLQTEGLILSFFLSLLRIAGITHIFFQCRDGELQKAAGA